MDLSQFAVFVSRYLPQFFNGFLVSLGIAVLAAPLALCWGLVLSLPRVGGWKVTQAIAKAYIELMRNTPLLVQMYLFYFGLPLLGIFWSSITCGVLAIALQHGAFIAEVFRSGIESISKWQWEAGRALGMRRWKTFRMVVFPQALLKVFSPLSNQLVVLVKDTSLVSAIGVMDLTLTGKVVIERSGASFEVFIGIAFFYLIMTSAVGGALRFAEIRAVRRVS